MTSYRAAAGLAPALETIRPRMVILVGGPSKTLKSTFSRALLLAPLRAGASAMIVDGGDQEEERRRQIRDLTGTLPWLHLPEPGQKPRHAAQDGIQVAATERVQVVLVDGLRRADVPHIARATQAAGMALIAVLSEPIASPGEEDLPAVRELVALADVLVSCERRDQMIEIAVVPRNRADAISIRLAVQELGPDPLSALDRWLLRDNDPAPADPALDRGLAALRAVGDLAVENEQLRAEVASLQERLRAARQLVADLDHEDDPNLVPIRDILA